MNASTISIILGASIASGGVVYMLSNQGPTPNTQLVENSKKSNPSTQPTVPTSTPSAPSVNTPKPPSSPSARPTTTSINKLNRPDGLSEEQWERAQERAQNFVNWANRSRDSERSRRYLEERVTRDAEAIAKRLGLPEESSSLIKNILTARIEKSISTSNRAAEAIINNPDSMATLVATRELQTSDAGISDELLAQRNAIKKELFGEFYPNGEIPEALDIGDLLRPDTPRSWYKDDDFLVSASTSINSNDAAKLMDYAGKLDYLDRQDDAFNRINRIERTVDLTSNQSNALKNLYIDNPSPTTDQIANIVGKANAKSIQEANNRRRRR